MPTPSPLLRCFGFYRRHPWLLAVSTVVTLVVNLSQPLQQHFVGRAFEDLKDGVAVRRLADGALDASVAWHWVWVLVVLNLARFVVQYGGTILAMALGQRLLSDLRDRILVQIQRLDLGWHLAHGSGEIVTRTTRDCDKVRDSVIGGWRQLLEIGIILVSSIAFLAWYHPLLGLVPLALVCIAMAMFWSQMRRLVELDRLTGDAYDAVTQDLTEGVTGVRVIKAFALERARIARFAGHVAGFAAHTARAVSYTAARVPLPQLVVTLGHVWVLVFGAWLVAHERIDIGHLLAAVMIMQALVFRIEPIGRLLQVFADARSSAQRIMEILDAAPAISSGSSALPAGPLGLRLNGVRVGEPGGRPVLVDLDLTINAGEVVALVGATGSGKSTLASLLPRLRDPDAGTVAVGSDRGGWHDLRTLDLGQLRRRVQVAAQDSFLFSDTLAANLRLAAPAASDAELIEALRLASAEDVLAQLPDGLQSRIGERGATLSGGQRQRLSLARALLARPAVLCADDATSALDAVTERNILANIRRSAQSDSGGTTVLLIASKLSTILLADRVLLLADGRIVADGRHADLAARDARYRDLLGLDEASAVVTP